MKILVLYLVLEVLGFSLTYRPLLLISVILFQLNKWTFRWKFICHLTQIYDWKYSVKKYTVSDPHTHITEVELTHRVCKISGKEQREQLPRFNGIPRWKTIKTNKSKTIHHEI